MGIIYNSVLSVSTKSKIGVISKHYLENINKMIKGKKLHKWRNTPSLTSWFKDLPSKERSELIKFDVADF